MKYNSEKRKPKMVRSVARLGKNVLPLPHPVRPSHLLRLVVCLVTLLLQPLPQTLPSSYYFVSELSGFHGFHSTMNLHSRLPPWKPIGEFKFPQGFVVAVVRVRGLAGAWWRRVGVAAVHALLLLSRALLECLLVRAAEVDRGLLAGRCGQQNRGLLAGGGHHHQPQP